MTPVLGAKSHLKDNACDNALDSKLCMTTWARWQQLSRLLGGLDTFGRAIAMAISTNGASESDTSDRVKVI